MIPRVPLTRATSVTRMLQQNRSFAEFYEYGEMIGKGGSGVVYEAVHTSSGTKWAVKIMDTRKMGLQSAGRATALAEITKEAEFLRTLSHPNITHLQDKLSQKAPFFT